VRTKASAPQEPGQLLACTRSGVAGSPAPTPIVPSRSESCWHTLTARRWGAGGAQREWQGQLVEEGGVRVSPRPRAVLRPRGAAQPRAEFGAARVQRAAAVQALKRRDGGDLCLSGASAYREGGRPQCAFPSRTCPPRLRHPSLIVRGLQGPSMCCRLPLADARAGAQVARALAQLAKLEELRLPLAEDHLRLHNHHARQADADTGASGPQRALCPSCPRAFRPRF